MLTGKQHQLLSFLIEHQQVNGDISPSFDEMKEAIGLASKSGAQAGVCFGRERLYPQTCQQARAIEVIKHHLAPLSSFKCGISRFWRHTSLR